MPEREIVAKALLLNEANEALVLQTGDYKGHPEKSHMPDFPGGIVESGESGRRGCAREIVEETGLIVPESSLQLVYAETIFSESENKSIVKFFYSAKLASFAEIQLSWEHESCRLLPMDELRNLELRPFYRNAITYLFEHKII